MLFITCFGCFDVCVHVVGDVQVKESRNDTRIAKRSKKEQESAMFKNMPRHDSFMLQHVQISEANTKTREEHAAACHEDAEKGKLAHATACPIHAAA